MLIGLCGGICAGKSSVAEYLVEEYGFRRLRLRNAESLAFNEEKLEARQPLHATNGSTGQEYAFSDIDSLINFVTKRWRERWLITDIWNEAVLDSLLRRPFFFLLSVDAPVSVRWKRYKERCLQRSEIPPTLEDFVIRSDAHLFDPVLGLAKLIDRAQVRLINPTSSPSDLHLALQNLDLTNEERLRPSWDQYFMELASLASQRSNCMKRRVGSVLVRERRVISTGYNGTPRHLKNCNQGGCPRCNDGNNAGMGLATCLCIHAEENALLEAGRERIREGSVLYCDTCPCLTCSIKIVQVGISEVVYSQSYSMDAEAATIFREAGVHLRQYSPPRKGLVFLAGASH
ncbi:deoxycytidylate deaminase [Xylona heveae TC161]|uniref:Deoxycytidylate deaminase n=1 Tax=Xylona heveae (strain CBS 132557 / TC161) TaxID=1328760 RepID=A0A165A8X6_XYLHT|nr:deoxycytidylate deaminase [Xylona heveae TC161]KZF20109.1 deoxycytidylate deaminase [Xylona heveae TC161]